MNLYEILLPVTDNDGADMGGAHNAFRNFLLEKVGGYTQAAPVRGAWLDGAATYHDTLVPYRVTCSPDGWRKIVRRAFELWPDQKAIFHAHIGTATIEEYSKTPATDGEWARRRKLLPLAPIEAPLLSVNDLAAIDYAKEAHNRLLIECYQSGQLSERQWDLHCKEDPTLAALFAALGRR
jgi:hypothetical protein